MKELIKTGFNKGLMVGVAIVTVSAVLTVVSIPEQVLLYVLEKKDRDLNNSKDKENEEA